MKNNYQILELQYFGSIELYSTLIHSSNVLFLQDVWYEKFLHLNRTRLVGANGPLLLTVPLTGGRDKKQKMKDVQISYVDPWQRIHWRGIDSSYRKAPWFEEYAPELHQLFNRKEKFLRDLNLKTMEWVSKKLKWKLDILSVNEPSTIEVGRKSTASSSFFYPDYQQVFNERHGFVPNLSILDLLFCEGPAAKKYLENLAVLKNDSYRL